MLRPRETKAVLVADAWPIPLPQKQHWDEIDKEAREMGSGLLCAVSVCLDAA